MGYVTRYKLIQKIFSTKNSDIYNNFSSYIFIENYMEFFTYNIEKIFKLIFHNGKYDIIFSPHIPGKLFPSFREN